MTDDSKDLILVEQIQTTALIGGLEPMKFEERKKNSDSDTYFLLNLNIPVGRELAGRIIECAKYHVVEVEIHIKKESKT